MEQLLVVIDFIFQPTIELMVENHTILNRWLGGKCQITLTKKRDIKLLISETEPSIRTTRKGVAYIQTIDNYLTTIFSKRNPLDILPGPMKIMYNGNIDVLVTRMIIELIEVCIDRAIDTKLHFETKPIKEAIKKDPDFSRIIPKITAREILESDREFVTVCHSEMVCVMSMSMFRDTYFLFDNCLFIF